ncbi:MAG: RagB/SusD family nutrient uptake outer membrane protein [Chitinophagaceae bacterium]|nr:RagB/SusD family nutrient uptake outer membrane protein [Chitinophagaceae bacterium]MCW5925489.1 RagB/SusD family nutrient uptake outer membrane protein [Chitinophagaceae bacterium]
MKKIYIVLSFTLFAALASCTKNVLDKKPLGIISDAVVWEDQTLIEAFLTQVYTEMSIWDNEMYMPGNSSQFWFMMYFINHMSDEAKANSTWSGNAYRLKFGNINETGTGGLLEWWERAYVTIRRLNEFIERVPNSPVDNAWATKRVAEAKFIRAYNYFSMAKRYGGVPIITKAQALSDPHEELFAKRNTEKEVYDFVISEVDACVSDLPETVPGSENGRPSRYAALALKSRAALYAASIADFGSGPQDGGVVGIESSLKNEYYQKSYDASKEIMLSGKHALYNADANKVTNFRNVFMKEQNAEAIFVRTHDDLPKDPGGNGSNYDFYQTPAPNAWGAGNIDGVYLEMAEAFEYVDGSPGTLDRTAIQQGLWTTADLWKDKDPRFYATIYTHNTMWKGAPLDFHQGILDAGGNLILTGSYQGILARALNGETGFGVLKYLDETKDNNTNIYGSKTDWIVFRYAEILLNYAEAALALGKPGEALDAINEIRDRAGIALLSSIDLNKIKHERRVELAFEGHRYWDLRRWRTAVPDLTRSFSGLQYILDYNTGNLKLVVINGVDGGAMPTFFEKNYYFPITPARRANNPSLAENPGY